MSVKYYIGLGVIGNHPYLDITEGEFLRIRKARDSLFVMLDLEIKFEMLLQNYVEYEETFLRLALEHLSLGTPEWDDFQNVRQLVNRRLTNLLAVCRQYIDQVTHDLRTIYGSAHYSGPPISEILSAQYDRLFGYRVMEAIRNYAMHRALPVGLISYPVERMQAEKCVRFRAKVALTVEAVCSDKEFKHSIATELRASGQKHVDLSGLVREYVQGLSCVHEELRKSTAADIGTWKSTITDVIKQYAGKAGQTPRHLVAYHLSDDLDTLQEVYLFENGIDRLEKLRRRRLPSRLSEWYVSNALD